MAPRVAPLPASESSSAPSKANEPASHGMGLRRRTFSTLANALNFTMGMAWLSVARLLISGGCCVSASSQEAQGAWLAVLFGVLILVPVGVCLTKRRLSLARRAEKATQRGDLQEARDQLSSSMAYQTVVSWGVGFALAGQLANAASATLPISPWGWRAAYAALLLVLVLLFACLIFCVGARLAGHAMESLADTLVSGAAYALALAFLDVVVAAFALEDVNTSPDLGYLAAFTAVTWACAALMLWALARVDQWEAFRAAEDVRQESQAALARRFFRANLRKLLGKSISMCGVAAAYALFYAWLTSITGGTMAFLGALLFFLGAFVTAIAGTMLVECMARRYSARLRALDLLPDTVYDDLAIAALMSLLQTSSSTGLEALAWLVGTALHSCVLVAWIDVTRKQSPQGNSGLWAMIAFACLLTLLTPLVTVRLAPPPVQAACLKLPERRPAQEPVTE